VGGRKQAQPPDSAAARGVRLEPNPVFLDFVKAFSKHVGLTDLADEEWREKIAAEIGTTRYIIDKLIDGGTGVLQANKQKLVETYMRKVCPGLPKGCLSKTPSEVADAFTAPPAAARQADVMTFVLPGSDQRLSTLSGTLPGTYVTYRYAFEHMGVPQVAREVLHVWVRDKEIYFRMSFRRKGNVRSNQAKEFTGKVLAVGNTLFFAGTNHGDSDEDRGRCLVVRNQPRLPQSTCNIGLLLGTRVNEPYEPCVATILLFRTDVEYTTTKLDRFIKTASRNEEWAMMVRDFGPDEKRQRWLRLFLDNHPAGPDRQRALNDDDPEVPSESTLRVDRTQFVLVGYRIRQAVIDSTETNAPFKQSWKPEPPDSEPKATRRQKRS
jgi:hypothetical protein